MENLIDFSATKSIARKPAKMRLNGKSAPFSEQSSPSNSRAFSTTLKQSFQKSQDSKLFFSQSQSFHTERWDYFLKVVLMGPPKCGKTSILRQYCSNEFHKPYRATLGINNQVITVVIGDCIVKLSLWDIPNDSKFAGKVKSHISSADAVLFVYDTTDEASATEVADMIAELMTDSETDAHLFAVANKIDQIRNNTPCVPIPQEIVAKFKLGLANTSARNPELTEQLFGQIINELIEKRIRYEEMTSKINGYFNSDSSLSENERSDSCDIDYKEEKRYLKSKFQSKFVFLKNEAHPSYKLKCSSKSSMKEGKRATPQSFDTKLKGFQISMEIEYKVPQDKSTRKRLFSNKACYYLLQ